MEAAASGSDVMSKPVCRYGKSCYSRNPGHFDQFAHPWLEEQAPQGITPRPASAAHRYRHQSSSSRKARSASPPHPNDINPTHSTHGSCGDQSSGQAVSTRQVHDLEGIAPAADWSERLPSELSRTDSRSWSPPGARPTAMHTLRDERRRSLGDKPKDPVSSLTPFSRLDVHLPDGQALVGSPPQSVDEEVLADVFPVGAFVELHSLVNSPEMNGKRGKVVGLSNEHGRLLVKIVDGRGEVNRRLMPSNLKLVQALLEESSDAPTVDHTGTSLAAAAKSKPVCRYGRRCYSRNPVHFDQFAHPWLDDQPVPPLDTAGVPISVMSGSTDHAVQASALSADSDGSISRKISRSCSPPRVQPVEMRVWHDVRRKSLGEKPKDTALPLTSVTGKNIAPDGEQLALLQLYPTSPGAGSPTRPNVHEAPEAQQAIDVSLDRLSGSSASASSSGPSLELPGALNNCDAEPPLTPEPKASASRSHGDAGVPRDPLGLPLSGAADSRGGKPVCRFGRACYSSNPDHFIQFAHPWLEDQALPDVESGVKSSSRSWIGRAKVAPEHASRAPALDESLLSTKVKKLLQVSVAGIWAGNAILLGLVGVRWFLR